MLRQKKISIFLLLLLFIVAQNAYADKKRKQRLRKNDFVKSEYLSGINSKLKLLLNKEDIAISDLSKDNTISLHMDTRDLLKKQNYPQSIVIKAYTLDENNQSTLVNSISSTIFNKKQAKNFLAELELPLDFTSSDLYFDIFDSNNKLTASFKKYIEVDSSVADLERNDLSASECAGEGFGECQIKYLLDNVKFESIPSRDAQVELLKETSGKYTVRIPLVRTKKFKVGVVDSGGGNTKQVSQVVNSGIFDFINNGIKVASVKWNETKEALDYLFNGDTAVFSIAKSGKVSVGEVDSTDAFLNIRNGDGSTASLKLEAGSLADEPIDGAIEYDGSQFYLTTGTNRTAINTQGVPGTPGAPGAQGPAGPAGPQGPAGADGSFSGGDADVNGALTFLSNGSLQDAVFNGNISIPTGASNGYVFTSDAGGNGTWMSLADLSVGSGNGTALANGIAGAIQFSDGANGFLSDSSNLFWDSGSSRLGIGTSAPLAKLFIGDQVTASDINYDNEYLLVHNDEGVGKLGVSGYESGSPSNYELQSQITLYGKRSVGSRLNPRASIRGYQGSNSNNGLLRLGADSGGTIQEVVTIAGINKSVGINIDSSALPSATLELVSSSSSEQGMILRAADGQTANLTEWQDNGSTVVASVDADGDISAKSLVVAGAGGGSASFGSTYWGNANVDGASITQGLISLENANSTFYGGVNWSGASSVIYTHVDSWAPSNVITKLKGASGQGADLNGGHLYLAGGEPTGNGTAGSIIFQTANGGNSGSSKQTLDQRMILDGESGNLGIGLSSPLAKLHVNGSLMIADGTESDGYVLTSDANGLASWQAGGGGSSNGAVGAIQFSDGASGFSSNASELFWDENSGELGVGTNNPLAMLNVSSSDGSEAFIIGNQASYRLSLGYHNAGTTQGFISNTYNSNSARFDIRMKGAGPENAVLSTLGSGNVGVSTVTPLAKLHVNGSLMIADGTESDGYVLTSDANGLASWQAGGGASTMDTISLRASMANTPSSNPAVIDLGSTQHKILFDDTTNESVNWTNIPITNYAGGALTAKLGYTMASATAGDVVLNVEVWCTSDGDAVDYDTESYDTANASSATTVPGTAGYIDEISITLTNKDSIANNDSCAFRITRNASSGSDTATGDLELRYAKIVE